MNQQARFHAHLVYSALAVALTLAVELGDDWMQKVFGWPAPFALLVVAVVLPFLLYRRLNAPRPHDWAKAEGMPG